MTIWKPPSSSPTGASPPAEFEADNATDGRLVRVGPTLHGWVYRAARGTALYRVLPIDGLPLPWRQEVGARTTTTVERDDEDGVLFPAAVSQHADYFLIRYEPGEDTVPLSALLTNGNRPDGALSERLFRAAHRFWKERGGFDTQMRALAASLKGDSPALRVVAVAWAVQALAGWRQHSAALLPMPSEIVFDRAGEVFTLWCPFLRLPDAEQLLAEPERILYLAPELMGARGAASWKPDSWLRADWYAFGVMLLQCFYRLAPPDAPETALARAANGTLYDAPRKRGAVPGWLKRAPATQDALTRAEELAHPDPARRLVPDPVRFGDALEAFGLRLTPAASVYELTNADRGTDALDLLRGLLATGETYDHLVMAARAALGVGRALEALDLLGRAVALEPDWPDARRGRALTIANAHEHAELAELGRREGPRLDALIWEDFNALGTESQQFLQLPLARYLVWRELYDDAARHAYGWLFDDGGTYRWWYLGMAVVYARVQFALATRALDAGAADAAQRVYQFRDYLDSCRESMKEVRRMQVLSDGDLYEYGTQLDALNVACLDLEKRAPRRPLPQPPAPPTQAPPTEAPNASPEERVGS